VVLRGPLLGGVRWREDGRGRADDEVAPAILFPPSDNASSCFMISAFSDFFAFSGAPKSTFAVIAQISSAVATPINSRLCM
jgi:hypothetical protein